MPTITGGWSSSDPDAGKKVLKAVAADPNATVKLPFDPSEATLKGGDPEWNDIKAESKIKDKQGNNISSKVNFEI